MSKVNLFGLDIAIKDLNNTIKISKEDVENSKDVNIRIDIINKEGNVVNGISTENLIQGLIVCSNAYLPGNQPVEDVKKYKCKLGKIIKKGAIIKISNFKDKDIRLLVSIREEVRFNFYGKNIIELIKNAEEFNTTIKASL